jgi:hypothetical protein
VRGGSGFRGMKHGARRKLNGIRGQGGYALLSVFLLVLIIGGMVGASLLGTRLGLQSTRNLIAGNDAFYAAESGVYDALSAINRSGVTRFRSDVVNRWNGVDMFGSPVKEMPGRPGIRYEAMVFSDEKTPEEGGTLKVTGYAATQARRTIEVRLRKGSLLPTGAIHMLNGSSCSAFKGNAFRIDGRDHTVAGAACDGSPHGAGECQSQPVPGISTVDQKSQECVATGLSDQQKDNVLGSGDEPSVIKTGGPGSSDLASLLARIVANPNVVAKSDATFNGKKTEFGTASAPQITHLTYDGAVTINGSASGVGILIVDDDLSLKGDFTFSGWIITGGELLVLGNVAVRGSIWTDAFTMVAGGSMSVEYCSACLDLADQLPGTAAGNFPRLMKVSGWFEG